MDVQAGGYSGSESYKYIEPILRDQSGELLVITPYMSMGYAKMLVGLGKRKQVRVITSSASEQVASFIRHRSKYIVYGYLGPIALFIFAAVIAMYFSFYQIGLGALGLAGLVALIALIRYRISKNSDIEVRIYQDRFVHEKAYISHEAAAVGSANLTFSGMRKNVERVEIITDPSRIRTLRDHFFDLWKGCK